MAKGEQACDDHMTSAPPLYLLAYGIGTAMVVVLSLISLLGVLIVPLAKKWGRVYEYVNLFLMALGTSALFSDAILHLIPGVCY